MLKIIDDEITIRKCHAHFLKRLKPFTKERIKVNIGHQGASQSAVVAWAPLLGCWMFSKHSDNRYWNAFGLQRPQTLSHIPITCEINIPAQGIDRRIGGALAKDRFGRIFLVHRGKIGGGKKGIGKSLFENYYRGAWTNMEDGDSYSTVALIGELHGPRFLRQLTQFIRKVDAIKNYAGADSSQTAFPFEDIRMREELAGESYGSFVFDEATASDRGLIIYDLHMALQRIGSTTGNDGFHDLFSMSIPGHVDHIFQIVTDLSENSIYAETAKLLILGKKAKSHPRCVLVIPNDMEQNICENIMKLGIELLPYSWHDNQAVFHNADSLIHSANQHSNKI